MPEPFLASLENLPPCAGIALGLDRMIMILADTATIDDVIAFSPKHFSRRERYIDKSFFFPLGLPCKHRQIDEAR